MPYAVWLTAHAMAAPLWPGPASSPHLPVVFQYTFLLLLIFLLEAMVGVLAYVYKENVETELALNLNRTFMDYYGVDADKTAAIDRMQREVTHDESRKKKSKLGF